MAEIRSVGQLVKGYESLSNWKRRFLDSKREMVEHGMAALAGGAGGLASGAVRGMGYSKIPRTDVDTDLALGTLAVVAGAAGLGGKATLSLLVFGVGMAAPALSRAAEVQVGAWRAR